MQAVGDATTGPDRGDPRAIVIQTGGVVTMKKLLLAATALMALTAGSAGAADLAVKAPLYKAPPPVVPVWSWTGCYVGGHVGGLWAHKDFTDRNPTSTFYGESLGGHDANSWLGGVQGG